MKMLEGDKKPEIIHRERYDTIRCMHYNMV